MINKLLSAGGYARADLSLNNAKTLNLLKILKKKKVYIYHIDEMRVRLME